MAIVPNDVKIQDFVEKYATLNKPIPYKDLNIYLVKMNDVYDFLENYDILTIDKNSINDIQIIQMNYLQFTFSLIVDSEIYRDKFLKMMKVCCGVKKSIELYNKNYNYGELMTLQDNDGVILFFNGWNLCFSIKENDKISLIINDVEISPKEFEEIRRLIMYLNIADYDDSYIDPDVREIMEDMNRIKNKSYSPPTIEKQMSVITSETGMSKSKLLEMTYREFTLLFNTTINKIDYQINRRADLQNKEFRQSVPHWIYEQSNNRLDGILINRDGFDAKMQNVT